jgi:hypothetical protein
MIFKSGGVSQPVSQGEIILKSHPLGWIKNKMPTATVICGAAIIGAIILFKKLKDFDC